MAVKLSSHLQKKLHKACRVCRAMKPLTEYYNAALGADGKRGACKHCADEYGATGSYSWPNDVSRETFHSEGA